MAYEQRPRLIPVSQLFANGPADNGRAVSMSGTAAPFRAIGQGVFWTRRARDSTAGNGFDQ